MSSEPYIEVELVAREKKRILESAVFCLHDAKALNDLRNSRKKWVAFSPFELNGVIGELSSLCNRTQSNAAAIFFEGFADFSRGRSSIKPASLKGVRAERYRIALDCTGLRRGT